MRNALVGMLVVACIFASGQAVGEEKSAKIVDEKKSAKIVDEKAIFVLKRVRKDVGSMKLSPDGTKLLFIRCYSGTSQTSSNKLALCDIKTGKEKELELPGYSNPTTPGHMVMGNVFDPTGRKLALGVGVDANKNGRHDARFRDGEKMQAVVYDLATDKTTMIGKTAAYVEASFDRTGKGLVIYTLDKEGKLFVTPVEKIKLRQLSLSGQPRGYCPTSDALVVLRPPTGPHPPGARPDRKMLLLDPAKDAILASLPMGKHYAGLLGNTCPQWTGDGRYLYLIGMDRVHGPRRWEFESRIWDLKKGKLVGKGPATVPIGPGPTATTMVLRPYPPTIGDKPVVHDVKANTTWTIDSPTIRLIASQGKYVLYAKKGDDGKETLYRGKISLPAK